MTNLIERLRSRAWVHRWHRKYREEAADEIERLTAERDAAFTLSRCQCGTDEACSNLAALRREIAELQANGPAMSRGTCGDGSDWMGTMREVMSDYASSAAIEARLVDKAYEDAEALRAEVAILQAKHDDDKSDLLAMQRERDVCGSGAGCLYKDAQIDALREDAQQWQRMCDNALLIVRDFATRNPKQIVQGQQIDPWGAHRWLDEYAARRAAT